MNPCGSLYDVLLLYSSCFASAHFWRNLGETERERERERASETLGAMRGERERERGRQRQRWNQRQKRMNREMGRTSASRTPMKESLKAFRTTGEKPGHRANVEKYEHKQHKQNKKAHT